MDPTKELTLIRVIFIYCIIYQLYYLLQPKLGTHET